METYQDHRDPYFSGHVHDIAYMEGSVYCYNRHEGLSSFRIATQEWKLLSNKCPFISDRSDETRELVAYDGHLHLVWLISMSTAVLCRILRYDWSDGAWKKMSSLEGGAIFLGKPSFGIPAGEQTKMVANRVYCLDDGSPPRFVVYGAGGREGDKFELSLDKIYSQSWPEETPHIQFQITIMNDNIPNDETPYYLWMDTS